MHETLWNDVVAAYDDHFLDLEVARKEYEAASVQLFDNLKGILLGVDQDSLSTTLDRVKLEVRLQSSLELGKSTLECGCIVEGVEWARVELRLAAPWGGQPRKLHAVIALQLKEAWLPWSDGQLSDFLKRNQWEAGEAGLNISQFPYFVEGRFLPLTENLELPSTVTDLIKTAVNIAAALDREVQVARIGEEALLQCRDLLEQEPIECQHTFEQVARKLGKWKGLNYFQVNMEGNRLQVWVGINPERREIVYGHTDLTSEKNVEFASLMKCKHYSYSGFPAGMLMTEEDIKNSSIDQISKKILNVYHEFLRFSL